MNISRRHVLSLSAGAAAIGASGILPGMAWANTEEWQKAVAEFGGSDIQSGRITLTAPEIAENGNNVPLSVSVDSPMSADDYVESIKLFADGNPVPSVATFHFTPMSGQAVATTRVRLAKTQNIIAVDKMSNG